MNMNLELDFSTTTPETQSVYSVSEISKSIKALVEQNFNQVRVRGEISGLKSAGSGHIYFSLKDNNAVLRAICWKGTVNQLDFKLEDGLEVVTTGKISTYEGQSNYQIIIQKIEIAGQGALLALLEKRKAQLAQEGLFDSSRKRPIPFIPKVVGVVTSATGAVIRDILHRIEDRMGVQVLLWSVLVQGADAAKQVSDAIVGLNNMPKHLPQPDVIIVARGGGSIEDLWAFNEEIVVRAAANSRIPLISAVGHATDTTLIDYASDKSAPTPTAAAEMATPVKAELLANLTTQHSRLRMGLLNQLKNTEAKLLKASEILLNFSQKLSDIEARLNKHTHALEVALQNMVSVKILTFRTLSSKLSPQHITTQIAVLGMKLTNAVSALNKELNLSMQRVEQNLEHLRRLLESYSHQSILARGFALVTSEDGVLIHSPAQCYDLQSISISFYAGQVHATVKKADRAGDVL